MFRLFSLSLLCVFSTCAPGATAPASERVIVSGDFGGVVTVNVRDVLVIPPPMTADEWQVDYSPALLEALTPADRLRSPGPDGWRFRAIAAGESELALTPVLKASPSGPPPAPPRFAVTIRAK